MHPARRLAGFISRCFVWLAEIKEALRLVDEKLEDR